MMSNYVISKDLLSAEDIRREVRRLGAEITETFRDDAADLVLVGLLKGSFIFMADLARAIALPLTTDFMTVSSYGDGTVSSGDVKVVMDLDTSIEGKNVIVVEDIVDTGRTFHKVLKMLHKRNPKSLSSCSFLSKPSRRAVEVKIDWIGCEIEDEFVVGYGLDYAQKYRNLPQISVLKECSSI